MYGKVKNIWDIKSNGGGSSIDTENFASKIQANTFTGKNIFENTGNVISIKTTDDQAFGIEFKDNEDNHVGFVGTELDGSEQKAVLSGVFGLQLYTNNKDININPGSGHLLSNSSKNWNSYLDNSILRSKDIKWSKLSTINYTSGIVQPSNIWNRSSWNWTINNLTSTNGFIEIMIIISWADNQTVSLKTELVWKSGLTTSKSPIISVEKNGRTYFFQFEITNQNKINIMTKHDNVGSSGSISWVRGWIKRGINQPSKVNELW